MQHPDSDWLNPADPPSSAELLANTRAMNPGYWRTDMPSQRFHSLTWALAERPLEPEARIVDAAGCCYAEATPSDCDHAGWVLTGAGIALGVVADVRVAA